MIHYNLRCSHDHRFDEWFDNIGDYDIKAAAGVVICPDCGDTRVNKAIMAPNVSGTGRPANPLPSPSTSCSTGMCANGMCGLN